MDSSNQGIARPPKPWERSGSSSGPAPFKPPSTGSTSDVVEASGTAKPGEIVSATELNSSVNRNAVGRPLPSRPWEQNSLNNYGGYGSLNYNSGYGSGMYSSYGGFGGPYSGGLYGNNMYRGYGGPYGGSGMYGGGMYNNGYGGMTSPYGMGMGGAYGNQDPNNPYGPPPSPPSFWMSLLRVMQGVVEIFGRISVLMDQNTHAFHMFMSALLQLFDRSGLLYGELARFVLKILGLRRRSSRRNQVGQGEHAGLPAEPAQKFTEGPKNINGSWDSVWGDGK